MKGKSVQINSVLNVLKTLAVLAFPLITYPYAFRILGVNSIGEYSFSKSIVNYFVLIAGLGINRFAVREGARLRDNQDALNTFSSQMFSINLISTGISYILLILTLLISVKLRSYLLLIAIQSLTIIMTTLGMEWLNSCLEDYSYIAVRTLIVQIISVCMMFLIVKDSSDIVPYTIVLLISNIGGYISNIFYIRRHVKIRFNLSNTKQYIPRIFLLFASEIASIIYVNSDITMLGIFEGDYQVGLYTASSKIYSVAQQLLSAAILVTLPRLSYYYATAQKDKYCELVSNAFNLTIMNVMPASLGLLLLSGDITIIFSGKEFYDSKYSLMILCISLAISLFGILYTNTILLPMQMEKEITVIMLLAAISNALLNIFMIPLFKHIGAAITTVLAEAIVMVMQAIVVKMHKINKIILFDKKTIVGTIIGCVWIAAIVLLTYQIISNMIIRMITAIMVSAIGYYGIHLILKNKYMISLFVKFKNHFKMN